MKNQEGVLWEGRATVLYNGVLKGGEHDV